MERYGAYKDSGVDWIGEIPEEWETRRFKHLLRIVGGNGFPPEAQGQDSGDYPFCKVSDINGDGWTVASAANYVDDEWVKENRINIVPEGSILMAKIGAALAKNHRKVNLLDCCIDNNMQALVPDNQLILLKYLYWVLNTVDMSWYDAGGTLPYVDNQKYLNDKSPFPTIAVQQSIADYLDAKTAEVDALIADCEREVELLREYRKAVISEAVTKGLDPDAPMRDSGVEWVGEIPEKWETSTIAGVTSMITNGYVGPTRDLFVNEGTRYLQSLHIVNGELDFDKHPYYVSDEWSKQHSRSLLHAGDVLVVQTGAIGNCAYVDESYAGCNCHALIVLRPDGVTMTGRFLYYYLTSDIGKEKMLLTRTGATHPHLNSTKIKFTAVVVPPIEDQSHIVAHLDAKTAEIDSLVEAKQQMADKLREYRKSLISEAVTGKFKVPGVK